MTRQANRSNVTVYTIDPRGLVAGTDLDQPVDPQQWKDFIRNSQDSLRVLAEDEATGRGGRDVADTPEVVAVASGDGDGQGCGGEPGDSSGREPQDEPRLDFRELPLHSR